METADERQAEPLTGADAGRLDLVRLFRGLTALTEPDALIAAVAAAAVEATAAAWAELVPTDARFHGVPVTVGVKPDGRPIRLTLPLSTPLRELGTLTVESVSPLTADDSWLLERLCDHAAFSLERTLHADEQRAAAEGAAHEAAVQARLESLAFALIRTPTHELAPAVAAHATAVAGAVATALVLVTESDELALVATVGYEHEPGHRIPHFSRDDPAPVARCIDTGTPVFSDSGPAVPQGSLLLTQGTSGCVPLLLHGRALGALAFTWDDARPRSEVDWNLLTGFADVCAGALDRSQRARLWDRTARLQDLTERLLVAATPQEVADAIVEQGIAALGAKTGAVVVASGDGRRLHAASMRGHPPDVVEDLEDLDVEAPLPLCVAFRHRRLVVVETRLEARRAYPALWSRPEFANTIGALLALPLEVGGRAIGALGFTFENLRRFEADDVAFLETLGRLCTQALDRAHRGRLYDRAARLQRVTAGLSAAVDRAGVAATILEEGSDSVGACGGLVVLESEDGTYELLGSRGCADEFVVPATGAVGAAMEAAHAGPVVELPLRFGDCGTGTLAFGFPEGYSVTEEDRTFLSALADLCGHALDRARLYDLIRASRDRLHQLLDSLHEGVLVVRDDDFVVDYANAEAGSFLEADDDLVGLPLADPWGRYPLRNVIRRALATRAPAFDEVRLATGELIDLTVVPDAGTAILVLRDDTRRDRAERAEREFVANAAHELRSPLAGIAAAVGALKMGAADDPALRNRFLNGLADETSRLEKLVKALLTLARAQGDPDALERSRVVLGPLLAHVASRLETRPGVRVEVDAPADVGVMADPTLLETALANLARNASRATSRGEIVFWCRSLGDGRIAIEVRDTGTGMRRDARARAFERFYRADPSGDGAGLGLPLVRELVRMLGGDAELRSKVGAGTTVRLTLPEAP